MPGYISLHRDIQKHWLYEENRVFSRYEAWLDILMRVNHAEGKVTHNGTVETVLRGSTIWSMGDMEKHWGWSNKKVKRFLLCLEGDRMLSMKSTTKKTYLTVINYDKYQGSDIDKAPPMHHGSTTEAYQKHTNNNELIITNNNNKDKDLNTSVPKGTTHTKFIPPTIEEVKNYCEERKNNVDHERWYDHYEAKGWMIGKNKMKDWKAAVRTWEKGATNGETNRGNVRPFRSTTTSNTISDDEFDELQELQRTAMLNL